MFAKFKDMLLSFIKRRFIVHTFYGDKLNRRTDIEKIQEQK